MTGIDILDSDEKIRELNKEISKMYEEYYEFDSYDMPCYFNKEKIGRAYHAVSSQAAE